MNISRRQALLSVSMNLIALRQASARSVWSSDGKAVESGSVWSRRGTVSDVIREQTGSVLYGSRGSLSVNNRPKYQSGHRHILEAEGSTSTLRYYREGKGVYFWKVIMQDNPGLWRGQVARIEHRPSWCPPQSARNLYASQGRSLPKGQCLPYGHPQNAMGEAKIIIYGFGGRHIHGTRSYNRDYQGTESLGCVRLLNGPTGMTQLLKMLGSNAVSEGVFVSFFR